MTQPDLSPSTSQDRRCADCGERVLDAGIKAWDLLFCDDNCADAWEDDSSRVTYAEDPLGGPWS